MNERLINCLVVDCATKQKKKKRKKKKRKKNANNNNNNNMTWAKSREFYLKHLIAKVRQKMIVSSSFFSHLIRLKI